jgi:hypothetical protein
MTMLTDGIKSKSLEDRVKQLDVAELLEQACAVREKVRQPGEEGLPVEGLPEEKAEAPAPEANAE